MARNTPLPFDRVTWEKTTDEQRRRFLQRDQADRMIAATRKL